MKLREIVKKLELKIISGDDLLDRDITGGYVSDMLSDVISHAQEGYIWVTLQTHLNIIPVASMKAISGIIIVNNREPDDETVRKAKDEQVALLGTGMKAFQVVGKLFQLGVDSENEDLQS